MCLNSSTESSEEVNELAEFEEKIGVKFKINRNKILQVLDHFTSYKHTPVWTENEKYEHYGDSLLRFLLSTKILDSFWPKAQVGDIVYEASLMCSNIGLTCAAKRFGLVRFMEFRTPKVFNEIIQSDTVLADTVERIVYIAYLEDGIEGALNAIHAFLEPFLNKLPDTPKRWSHNHSRKPRPEDF